ncbi:MAG: aryl-sulfate sulfotransferase [Deltaproteobacteria bacterium]
MIGNIRSITDIKWIALVIAIGFFSISGCNNSDPAFQELTFRLAPNERAPLAGILELTTLVPTRIVLDVSDGDDNWQIVFEEFNTDHSLAVLGFRPGEKHTVLVSALDEDGGIVNEDLIEVETDPLPEDFPDFSVTSDVQTMEPGVTLFEAGGFLIIVDEPGEVVWYYRIPSPQSFDRDVRRMANGNLLLLLPTSRILEIDMLGNTVRSWYPARSVAGDEGSIPVDAAAFHHEIFEMESGNFLVLSLELRTFDDYPSSVTDPLAPVERAEVVGDVIVEFAPDGTLVNEWPVLDILDPFRLSYSSLLGIWDGFFQNTQGVTGPTRDWSHGNGVIHDTRDDSLIVSLRHQDAVIKFSRQTGELIWILGTHDNWDPVVFGDFLLTPLSGDEFFFQYHQHAPMITESGNIILFDNGNNRASPFDPIIPGNIFSRAVEYSIDEFSKEVDLVWESTGFSEEVLFAGFLGDADSLPETGNVLITFGGNQPARIVEVTRDTPPEQVFEILVPNVEANAFVYRAERLPSLYP